MSCVMNCVRSGCALMKPGVGPECDFHVRRKLGRVF